MSNFRSNSCCFFFPSYIAEEHEGLMNQMDPGGGSSSFLLMDAKCLDLNFPSALRIEQSPEKCLEKELKTYFSSCCFYIDAHVWSLDGVRSENE